MKRLSPARWVAGLSGVEGLRRGLLVAALSGLAASGSFLVLDPRMAPDLRVAGAAAVLVLVVRWLLRLRNADTNLLLDLAETLAVLTLGFAVDPDRSSGVLYAGLAYRAAFGGRRDALRAGVAYSLAHVAASALAGGRDHDYSVAGALLQVPVFFMVALLVSSLVAGVAALRSAARRERVLQHLGFVFLGARDRQALADGAAAAIDEVLGGRLEAFEIRLQTPGAEPVVASRGEAADARALVLGVETESGSAGSVTIGHPDALAERDSRWIGAVASQLGLAVGVLDDRALRQARTANARIRALVEDTGGVALVVDRDLAISWSTPGALELFGEAPDALVGRPVLDCVHRADRARAHEALTSVVAGDQIAPDRFTVRLRGRSDPPRWVEVSVSDLLADDDVGALVIQMRDVSARVALEQDVRRRDDTDGLTHLPNRARFETLVGEALESGPAGVAVALIDIDGLRLVNEAYGYGAGDEVLVDVARRLAYAAAGTGPVARVAADEFAVLLQEVSSGRAACDVVGRLLRVFERPIEAAGVAVHLRASAGVARARDQAKDAKTLIAAADAAMQDAQEAGGGCCRLFAPRMHAERLERLTLVAELAAGVDRGELELEYQPVAAARSGRWCSAEALVRWRHPELGRLMPARFIPLAEDSELIVKVGEWVLHEACHRLAGWQRDGVVPGDFAIAVNVSAVQFARPALLEMVSTALRESGLDARCLTLEITETAVADFAAARPQLEALKRIGVRLAIDDYGTGQSSLAYLKDIPADVLKVPRPFVRDIGHPGSSGGAIVEGIVGLARSLGLVALAEGVETPEQLDGVVAAGCELIQGYLYSRPLPAGEFAAQARTASRDRAAT